jgi:hypothetical protein
MDVYHVSRHYIEHKGEKEHGVTSSRGHIDKKIMETEYNRHATLERLTSALNALQIAVLRRFSLEKRQKSLEAELARMEHTHTQLIAERDDALARCERFGKLHSDLYKRVLETEKIVENFLDRLESSSPK